MYKVVIAAIAHLALVSGCASAPRQTAPGVIRLPQNDLPAPARTEMSAAAQDFYIGPLDELIIDVLGVAEMSDRRVQVDNSGRISFPLVGSIQAAGRSPGELAQAIQTGLRANYVRDPRVTVNITKTVSQLVTVEGEVREPGVYPILGKSSLLKAIASAKGTTEFSKLTKVVVFRQLAGKSYAALYDLRAIRDGVYPDPQIFSGDIVVVDESRARRIFRDFLQIAPLLSTPLVIALQNN